MNVINSLRCRLHSAENQIIFTYSRSLPSETVARGAGGGGVTVFNGVLGGVSRLPGVGHLIHKAVGVASCVGS